MSETDTAKAKREAEAEKKAAEEQAKQDEADVETFLSAHRGEALLRGQNHGSFDLESYVAACEAEAEAKADAEAAAKSGD